MKRLFLILYSGGVDEVYAKFAADAEQRAFVPGGAKAVLAVVDASALAVPRSSFLFGDPYLVEPRDARMPFTLLIGDGRKGAFA